MFCKKRKLSNLTLKLQPFIIFSTLSINLFDNFVKKSSKLIRIFLFQMAIYECPIPGCGRRFKEQSKLEDHVQRRHDDETANLKDISNNFQSEPPTQIEKVDKATLIQKKEELLAQEKEMQETLTKMDEQEEEVQHSMKDILESQKKLTAKFILDKTGMDDLGDITQVAFELFFRSCSKLY